MKKYGVLILTALILLLSTACQATQKTESSATEESKESVSGVPFEEIKSPEKERTVLISAPFIQQSETVYVNACESVSTVMALQQAGFQITVEKFIEYLDTDPVNRRNFDPNEVYGGTPGTPSGMGCYAPVILKALDKILKNEPLYGKNLTGKSLDQLCAEYLDEGVPVVIWGTQEMGPAYPVDYEEGLHWIRPEHCMLLVGYNEKDYIIHDPLAGANTHYEKGAAETAYAALGKQAIAILEKDD